MRVEMSNERVEIFIWKCRVCKLWSQIPFEGGMKIFKVTQFERTGDALPIRRLQFL